MCFTRKNLRYDGKYMGRFIIINTCVVESDYDTVLCGNRRSALSWHELQLSRLRPVHTFDARRKHRDSAIFRVERTGAYRVQSRVPGTHRRWRGALAWFLDAFR